MTLNKRVTLSEIEASEYLGLSRATLRRGRMNGLRENHRITPPFLKLGRSIKYLKSDLDVWLDSHRVIPANKSRFTS